MKSKIFLINLPGYRLPKTEIGLRNNALESKIPKLWVRNNKEGKKDRKAAKNACLECFDFLYTGDPHNS